MARRDPYLRELQKIARDQSPAAPTTRSAAEIESDIQAITERLRGPLHNVERLDLIEARQGLRKQLAAVTSHLRAPETRPMSGKNND